MTRRLTVPLPLSAGNPLRRARNGMDDVRVSQTSHHPVRRASTDELSASQVQAIREMLEAAFGSDEEEKFTDDDWEHATGGVHFIIEAEGRVLAHAAVVQRELHLGDRPIRTGYVEAVATAPGRQRQGLGTSVMREVGSYINEHFQLGGLGTGSQGFYERLGWEIWQGPSAVRAPTGSQPTPDDDGYIMVLRTPSSPDIDLTDPISCEWRRGDVW